MDSAEITEMAAAIREAKMRGSSVDEMKAGLSWDEKTMVAIAFYWLTGRPCEISTKDHARLQRDARAHGAPVGSSRTRKTIRCWRRSTRCRSRSRLRSTTCAACAPGSPMKWPRFSRSGGGGDEHAQTGGARGNRGLCRERAHGRRRLGLRQPRQRTAAVIRGAGDGRVR
jgi:hypothetical protein